MLTCRSVCAQYLHRFQWTHLSERLAYEQTVLQQRLRTEVSQAKRETNFYLNNVEKSTKMDKLRQKRLRDGAQVSTPTDIIAESCDTDGKTMWLLSGGGEDVGLHSAPHRGRDSDEEEHYPKAPGQSPPHATEEPIECLTAGQDFQLRPIKVTVEKGGGATEHRSAGQVMAKEIFCFLLVFVIKSYVQLLIVSVSVLLDDLLLGHWLTQTGSVQHRRVPTSPGKFRCSGTAVRCCLCSAVLSVSTINVGFSAAGASVGIGSKVSGRVNN